MEVDGATGAAARRRQRRLRAWLRHERQSVAAALAEALHHSAGPREKVVERRETHNVPRSQTTPLRGKRPAPLSEVAGPQVAVTSGYVAASVPLLGAPSLADSSAEVIDGSALSFLLQRALEVKRKEEEEEAVEAAELVELEEKLAAAEERLLAVLWQDREEVTRITPQTLSSPLPRRTVRCSLVRGQREGWEEEGKEEEEEEAEDVEDSPVSAPLLFMMSLTILWPLISGSHLSYVVFA